ncbi:hypothetical protein BDP27DRAFT_1415434 [Rhodocollybia butyracea]|uniref:Uncharacterized protein n=1 Tax=Rhodocollybia butyracea TaxID=206335 RepID=A0A9P5Q045_9AGAR|nr:hypothetical protein BDP27DRAFT_1415434 [Rhodocollybia butyracea]
MEMIAGQSASLTLCNPTLKNALNSSSFYHHHLLHPSCVPHTSSGASSGPGESSAAGSSLTEKGNKRLREPDEKKSTSLADVKRVKLTRAKATFVGGTGIPVANKKALKRSAISTIIGGEIGLRGLNIEFSNYPILLDDKDKWFYFEVEGLSEDCWPLRCTGWLTRGIKHTKTKGDKSRENGMKWYCNISKRNNDGTWTVVENFVGDPRRRLASEPAKASTQRADFQKLFEKDYPLRQQAHSPETHSEETHSPKDTLGHEGDASPGRRNDDTRNID